MAKAMDLRVDRLRRIRDVVQSDLQSLSQLAKVQGIGLKSPFVSLWEDSVTPGLEH